MTIVAHDLTFRYPAQEHDALRGITLTIEPGVVTWLTGALGSGTSTMLLAAAGLAPRLTAGTRGGRVELDGRDPSEGSPLAASIAYLGPSPMLQLSGIAKTVRDEIAVGPMNLGWSRGRITAAVDNALDRLGVRHLADRAPARLSGGETQRVLIASLLATAPTSWLLDEPFSALDRRARVDVANLLVALAADGATVVVACDDADAMLPAAHRLVVFSAGRIALDGSPRQLLAGDLLPATGSGTTDAAGLAAAAGFAAPRPITVSSLLPQLIRIEPRTSIAASEHPDFTDRTTPVLQLEGVAFRYPRGSVVLHDTSLRVSAGETVGLFGTNGAGKSTLLRLAMALEHPEVGVVHTLGLDTAGHGPEDLAPRVGFLFQQPERQLFAASVRAECRMAPALAGWTDERTTAATMGALALLGLLDVVDEHPGDLPLPRRRLVALAAVLVTDPELLLLDEPTAALDAPSRRRVIAMVRERSARGRATIAITHDAPFAHEALDRALLLIGGTIAHDGVVRDVLDGFHLARPAALEVALSLGLPAGADRHDDVAASIAPRPVR